MDYTTCVEPSKTFSRSISKGSGRTNFVFHSAAEIAEAAEEKIPWVAKPYVARGVITDVEGKAKDAGKTTFLLAMIRSVLCGGMFLGQPTQATKVVMLTEERPTSFRAALKRANLLGREGLFVLYWHETKGAAFLNIVLAAIEECGVVGAELLVVDTINQFARFREEDENHTGPVLEVMEPLQEAASQRLAVVMGRHARKSGGRVGESGRGSSAFTGAADIVVSLRRPDGQSRPTLREIHALSRFEETPELLVIELTDEGYVALGTQADIVTQETKGAIRGALPKSATDAIGIDDLLHRLPTELNGRTTAQAVLGELMAAQTVTRVGRGVKGDPFRYFNSFCQSTHLESGSTNSPPPAAGVLGS